MINSKDPFSKFILISLGFHGIILVALTVKVMFFPADDVDFKEAVRIDVVALPEKVKDQPKPPKVEPMPMVVAKKDPPKPMPMKPKPMKPKPMKPMPMVIAKKPVKKLKDQQNSALDRLKQQQSINKLKEQAKKPIEYKGNAISKGDGLEGIEKLKDTSYRADLQRHIKGHWNLPEWLANANLEAKIRVKIGRRGEIIAKVFVEKSGNDVFDQQVLTALDESNPLPPPPSSMLTYYATKGARIAFP